MDLNFNAMDKLLSGSLKINSRTLSGNATMYLDFGESLTTAYIVQQGKPIFHRQINTGCGGIERHIYEETFAPAEEVRKMKEEGYNFFGKEAEDKYYMILRPYFYHLIDEIRKIIEFYTSRPNTANIDQIFLFGGGSGLTGFSDYCEFNFNIPTEKIETLSTVKFKEPETSVASCMNAIGALIRL
jgi:type IV pilus assembly protein PilM